MAYLESISIAKGFSIKNSYKIDANQELLAIGASNAISALVSSYPVTGSFSRTAVNSQSSVEEALKGSDGICRQLKIKYKNAGERVFRTTTRAIRRVALLHGEAELGLVDQLNEAARATNVDYTRRQLDSENVSGPDVVPSLPPVECCCSW